jgi:uncharacterized membrane protein
MFRKLLSIFLFTLMGTTSIQAMECEIFLQLEENPDTKIEVSDEDYLESSIQREEYQKLLEKVGSYSICMDEKIKNILTDTSLLLAAEENNRVQEILKLEEKLSELKNADKNTNQALQKQENKHYRFKKEVESSNISFNKIIEDLKLSHETQIKSLKDVDGELNTRLELAYIQIGELASRLTDSDNKIDNGLVNLNTTLSDKTLYGIISILTITLFVMLLFMLLRKSVFKQRTDLEGDLEAMKKEIQEESIKVDNKLINMIESQLSIESAKEPKSEDTDHSLALKVADEIVRIQKNTLQMDTKTKGLKQLIASVKRIQDNFSANGYDVVEMLNQPYDEGMKVSANFIPNEDLSENEQIITRIIKPQVNYQGLMIQAAQIEVSIGE